MVQKTYTNQEWAERENYYIEALQNLVLPLQPTTKEVMEITSKLDALYTDASFDYGNLARQNEIVTMDLKNAEAEMFAIIKQQQLTTGSKITENDVKGLVKTYIAEHNIKGYGSDLYSIVKYYIMRTTFMEQTLKAISKKKESLVTDSAMLKIENSFSGAKDVDKL